MIRQDVSGVRQDSDTTREAPGAIQGPLSGSWHRHAACRHADPDLFFSDAPRKVAEARALCATCPVRAECREEGQQEDWGVWGGELRHRVKAGKR